MAKKRKRTLKDDGGVQFDTLAIGDRFFTGTDRNPATIHRKASRRLAFDESGGTRKFDARQWVFPLSPAGANPAEPETY